MLLSRTQLEERSRGTFRVKPVKIDALDGELGCRIVSGKEREEFLESDPNGMIERWLASVLVGEDGAPLFKDRADLSSVLSGLAIDEAFEKSLALNGITRTGKESQNGSADGGSD